MDKMTQIRKLNRELKHLSSYDSLTGIYNRRMILKELEKEIIRYERYKHSFCLILFDVDFFKNVNDTYGHLFGDKVLKEMCIYINKHVLRQTDSFGRYGGEEFLIIAPETNLNGSTILAKRIKENLSSIKFKTKDKKNIYVTISIGIAEYKDGEKLDDVLAKADKALYAAKNNGRNRIEKFKDAG